MEAWRGYSGALIALAGTYAATEHVPDLAGIVPREHFPKRFFLSTYRQEVVAAFLREAIDLLVTGNSVARDIIREQLATELSPSLLTTLFEYIRTILTRLDGLGADEDSRCVFTTCCAVPAAHTLHSAALGQLLQLLTSIFERSSSSPAQVPATIDDLLFPVIGLVHQVGPTRAGLRLRAQFARLITAAAASKQAPSYQDRKLRIRLLEYLINWASHQEPPPGDEFERDHREADLATMLAVAALLDGLILRDATGSSEVQGKTDVRWLSRMDTFFGAVLDRVAAAEVHSEPNLSRFREVMDAQTLLDSPTSRATAAELLRVRIPCTC